MALSLNSRKLQRIFSRPSISFKNRAVEPIEPAVEPKNPWTSEISKTQKIYLSPKVAAKLFMMDQASKGNEYSGFGFVDIVKGNLMVYDVVLMDLGTYGWTEFSPKKILALMDRLDNNKMKLWFHRHPVGNGIPGDHNWSGTDTNTARNEPLGSLPELVKWSASIVKTPLGWVGRIDNCILKKTIHVDVVFAELQDVQKDIEEINKEKAAALKKANAALVPAPVIKIANQPSKVWTKDWERDFSYSNALFDLEQFETAEYMDELNDSLVNDFFYSLEDEVQMSISHILEELDKVARYTTRLANKMPADQRSKVDKIASYINAVYGGLTETSNRLIDQVNDTRDIINQYLGE